MPNAEIEKLFNEIKKCKDLKHIEYLFRKPEIINNREVYIEYKKNKTIKNYEDFIETAQKYVDTNKNYLGFAMMSEYDEVFKVLEQQDPKEFLSYNLVSLFEAMKKSGIIEILINNHNKLCEQLCIQPFSVDYKQIEDEFNFKVNSREKLPILYLKNAFWLDKYEKILRDLYFQEGFENGLMQQDADYKELNYLTYMNSKKNAILEEIFKNDIVSNDNGQTSLNICAEYGEEYKKLFDDVFTNSENDIAKDYNRNYSFEKIIGTIAQKRFILLNALLKNQIKEAKEHNLNPTVDYWGVYKDKEDFLLGLEPRGYIVPATFYVPQYVYSDVLNSMNMKSYAFSEYIPLKDITNEKNFESNVLVKPTPEQIKQIKLQSKQKGQQTEFLKRSLEQFNGKPHLLTMPNTIEIEIGE